MMVKKALLIALIAVIWAGIATAQMTIGIVDTRKIADQETRFVKAQKEVDNMVSQFENERSRYEEELQRISQEFEDARGRADDVEVSGRQMADKSRVYQKFIAETFGQGGIIEAQTDSIMAPLYEKLEQACRKVGERLKLSLILDRESLDPLWMADTLDITDDVLAELKKTW